MEEQKRLIKECLSVFDDFEERKRGNYLVFNIDEDKFDLEAEKKANLTNLLKQFIEIEVKELGFTIKDYEKAVSPDNDLIFTVVNKPDFDYRAKTMYKKVKNKGEIIKRIPIVELNLKHFLIDIKYRANSKEEVEQFFKDKVIKELLHEVQHLRQDLMIKNNILSEENLLYSRENFIVAKEPYLYDMNYSSTAIESDAYKVACEKCIKLMGENEEWKKERERCIDSKIASKYSMENNKGEMDRNDALVLHIDELMKDKESRKEAFSRFPILQKEYNLDGSRKSAKCLLQDMKKELAKLEQLEDTPEKKARLILDTKQMYYKLVYRDLKREDAFKELVEFLEKEEILEHYNNMKDILYFTKNLKIKHAYSEETKEMVRELHDEKINYMENQISRVSNLELNKLENETRKIRGEREV